MKRLRLIREYEVVLPDRNTPMWTAFERTFVAEAKDDGLDGKDIADILSNDEAIASWLTFQIDIGECELNVEVVTEETWGGEMIDTTVYDPKLYKWSLEEK